MEGNATMHTQFGTKPGEATLDPAISPTVFAITPNPALDISITLDKLHDEATHRIPGATRKLGGKGINVALVAAQQGYPARMYGPVSHQVLAQLEQFDASAGDDPELHLFGAHPAFTDTPVRLRETWSIHQAATGTTMMINEDGDAQPEHVFRAMCQSLAADAAITPSSVVTISGSWPKNTDPGVLDQFIDAAQKGGAKAIIVDCAGANLKRACERSCIVKPNHAEALATLGIDDPIAAARMLVDLGSQLAIVSLGADGLIACDKSTVYRATPPRKVKGNPTGAGDALVAAIATALLDGADPETLIKRAIAWSSAAVLVDYAGAIDSSWQTFFDAVKVTTDDDHDDEHDGPP